MAMAVITHFALEVKKVWKKTVTAGNCS